jgi:hypothetical protein
MKKTLPIILVLAAIAAAVFIFIKRRGENPDLPPGLAADLAPAETILFIELPDVSRTQDRWKETSLYKISQEPEWKEFTAKWDDFVAQNEMARDVFGFFGEVGKADPAGLFLAMTAIDSGAGQPVPKIVGGFPYRGKKSDVEGVVRKLKEQLVKSWPAAKSELSTHEGVEIETLQDPQFTAAMAYQDNWFFFATDVELLRSTLSRYLKKPNASAALAKDALWKETADHGSEKPDLRLWLKWKAFEDKLAGLSMMTGPGAVPQIKDPNPMQALVYTWKLDGPLMRDRIYAHMTQPLKAKPMENRSLAFTNPATYAYLGYEFNEDFQQYAKAAIDGLTAMGIAKAIEDALSPKGLKLEDVFTTFGPEVTAMSAWEAGGVALPDFFAAAEVKDKAKARLFAELIAGEIGSADQVVKTTEGDTTIWTETEGTVPFLRPTLAVNDRHLMFGLNTTALKTAMKQLAEKGPNLTTHSGSPFNSAVKTAVQPAGMLLYVDFKTLFERVYDKVKPMAAFALVGEPEAAKYFDAAKLPQATTISRHLSPMVFSYGTQHHGWVLEGTGPITFMSIYAGALPTAVLGIRATMPSPAAPIPQTAPPVQAPPRPAPPATPQPQPANPPL